MYQKDGCVRESNVDDAYGEKELMKMDNERKTFDNTRRERERRRRE